MFNRTKKEKSSLDEISQQFLKEMQEKLKSEVSEEMDEKEEKSPQGNSKQATISVDVTMPQVTLEDVILSANTRTQLEEGIAKLRFHKIIYEDWNFASVDKQGRSVILNFFGDPGTGKTLTAEAFSGSLNLPIIKLGIAELESKFMGETSKNIQTVFQKATESGAVLFFDEADTLLGKRLSSVTQGIDNEVNSMRSTLLIELEKFNGIAIFATNFAKNYDEAFRSRISHHIHFDLPDLENRKALWNRMLVPQIPLAGEREKIINLVAELTEGFSGREIRTCMRLVLPKALLEAEKAGIEPKVTLDQLKAVIEQIKLAKKAVASSRRRPRTESVEEVDTARSLLGISE